MRSLGVDPPERAGHPRRCLRFPTLVLEHDAHFEPLAQVVPGELAARAHAFDEDEPRPVGPAQEPWTKRTDHRPARVLLEAAPVALDARVAGPPVGQGVTLGKERTDFLPGKRENARLLRLHSPRTDCTRCASSSMKRWRSDDTATAATRAPSPPKTKRNIGPSPARPRKRLDTPRASMSLSPTFRRVKKVDDIPARFRSRNSSRLKWVPTATMSSAPFSCASRMATSSLIPGEGRTAEGRPNRSMRSRPGACPSG